MNRPELPSFVIKSNGEREPFDADRISEALFEATEALANPDTFLARELSEGVVHFLALEDVGDAPRTQQIRDLVAKVVRELGHPELARAFANRSRRRPIAQSTDADVPLKTPRETGSEIFGRDLVAAHEQGLIVLGGRAHPDHLAHALIEGRPWDADLNWLSALVSAKSWVEGVSVLDSPELAFPEPMESGQVRAWLRTLDLSMEAMGRRAIVNVNCAEQPPWAQARDAGPLFGADTARGVSGAAALALLRDAYLALAPKNVRLDWHLGARDFSSSAASELTALAALSRCQSAIAFTFDRPRRSIMLSETINRRHSTVLMRVGLDLLKLLELPAVEGDLVRFMAKLPSLTRMGLSAATQKRQHLRKRASEPLSRGFLLERARLVVVPLHLDQLVRRLLGHSFMASKVSLDCAKEIVNVITTSLREAAGRMNIEAFVDASPPVMSMPVDPLPQAASAVGALHGRTGAGTLELADRPSSVEWAPLLSFAWKKTDLARIIFNTDGQSAA